MKFYNILDEKGRFCGLKFDNKGNGQFDSHTMSYLACRRELKKMEDDNQEYGLGNEGKE